MVLPFRLRFQTSVRHKPVRLPVRTPPCHPSGMIVHSIPLLFAIRTPKPNPQTPKQMPSNTNSTPSTFTTPLPTSRSPFFSSILQVLPRPFFLSLQGISRSSTHPNSIPVPSSSLPLTLLLLLLLIASFSASASSSQPLRAPSNTRSNPSVSSSSTSPSAPCSSPRPPRPFRSASPSESISSPRTCANLPLFLIHQIQLRHAPRRPGTPQSLQKTLLRRLLRLRQQRYPPRSRAFPRPRLRSRPIQAGTANRRRFARSSP